MWDGVKFTNKGKEIYLDPTLKITNFRRVENRPVVAASLGPVLLGAAAPKVNPGNSDSSALGAAFRVGRNVERNMYYKYRRSFRRFVERQLEKHFQPLDPNTDLTFETWIKNTPYPAWRKEQLIQTWLDMNFDWATCSPNPAVYKEWFRLKSFIKDETYVGYKHSRTINSRSDQAKCIFGPIVQAVSNKIMKTSKHFIKYVPVHERPQYILDYIFRVSEEFSSSDFTSFEAHFTEDRMKDCELPMFKHMLSGLPNGHLIYRFLEYAKCINDNICVFKYFVMQINAKRMSGEMDTSLSNGFSNLMWLKFSFKLHGMDPDQVPIVVEGDDALCCIFRSIPDSYFEEFGLDLKIEKHSNVEHASFCGLVFDSVDRTIVTDIFDTVATFGWTTANYANSSNKTLLAILRCKALSLAYQYKGCPILSKLALKMMELTEGVNTRKVLENRRFIDAYHYEILAQALEYIKQNGLNQPVGNNTRNLVEKLYSITIADQLLIEQEIDKISDPTQPLNLPVLMKYAPKDYLDYFDKYCVMRQTRDYNALDLLFSRVQEMNTTFVVAV